MKLQRGQVSVNKPYTSLPNINAIDDRIKWDTKGAKIKEIHHSEKARIKNMEDRKSLVLELDKANKDLKKLKEDEKKEDLKIATKPKKEGEPVLGGEIKRVVEETDQLIKDLGLSVKQGVRAEYDMWVWVYSEVANLRQELSRLGSLVRINTPHSPQYLEAYHAHIYSLYIPICMVIDDDYWKMIEVKWLRTRVLITRYLMQRKVRPNLKIPLSLIMELDSLYRIGLLLAQKGNMGIKISSDIDMDKALERAIVGAS